MAKINLLDKSIYNKIAAGEVIERPFSVVKELVENSIDAKCTQITIEIKNGGIDKIEVKDNGTGIECDSVKNAFLSHATSKICSVNDLSKIQTLGFRGEALASITSVSQTEMVTKYIDEELGTKIEINGGNIENLVQIYTNCGTTVTVTNLFFNIPARLKFLKKPKQEEHEITNYVSRLILANPKIAFTYIVEDKEVFSSSGKSLEDAILTVYGLNVMQKLLPVKFNKDGMKLYGYCGKPSFYKANKTYQTFILKNRIIANPSLSVALNRSYEKYLVKGQFPFAILFIEIDSINVDVNVHPNKAEVRFLYPDAIFSLIYRGIQDTILKNQEFYSVENDVIDERVNHSYNNSLNIDNQNLDTKKIFNNYDLNGINNNQITENYNSQVSENCINQPSEALKQFIINKISTENELKQTFTGSNEIETKQVKIDLFLGGSYDNTQNTCVFNEPGEFTIKSNNNHLNIDNDKEISNNFDLINQQNEQTYLIDNAYKVIGKLFNTYLMIEQGDNFILIDQHAAHERINYDKYLKSLDEETQVIQPLLIPYNLDLNNLELSFIEEHLQEIKELGFDIEPIGAKTYSVYAVPQVFNENFNCGAFFSEVFKDINQTIYIKDKMKLKEFLMLRACKGAVKAGNDLKMDEVTFLIDSMIKNQTELFCPHGRPIAIKFNKTNVEKWFKRIV